MGGSMSGMGQVADGIGAVKKLFTDSGDTVNGTTQTVGQWKNDGLNDADIAKLGTNASPGLQIARGAMRGAMQGAGGAMARGRSGVQNPIQIGTNPQYPQYQPPQYQPNNDYLAQNGQRFNPYANPNNPLFGG